MAAEPRVLRHDPWSPPEAPPRRAGDAVRIVAATIAGSLGPAWRLGSNDATTLALACIATAALAATAVSSWRRGARPLAAASAVAAAAVVGAAATAAGASSTGLALVGGALAALALCPISGAGGPDHAPMRPSAGLVLAGGIAWHGRRPELTAVLLAGSAGLLVLAWRRPAIGGRVDLAVGRAISALTRWIAAAVVLLAALPTLYLPGAILRLTDRRRSRPGWQARRVEVAELRRDAAQPFATTPRTDRRRRQRWALVVLASALPAALIVSSQRGSSVDQGRPITFGDWAFPDEPWVDELYEAGFGVTYHPSLQWKSTDVESTYLQVRDGVRRSWQPDDAELEVWFLGGSALWGLGQRDDRTIPSEVAKLADKAGIPIRAVNLGVPGYTQWQQEAALGYRLSRGERPDLVVVYDGANDLTAMIYRAGQGIEPLDEPPNRFHEQLERDTRYPPERRGEPASDEELVETFLRTYGAGVDLTIRTADAYGVPVALYWQPQYLSTQPSAVDAPLLEAFPWLAEEEGDREREVIAEVRRQLPAPVVDLGSALDDVDEPTWFDTVHTNELGAQIVAAELWETLRPQVEALADAN
jgi:lysophospholipase L1-like esterase